MRHVLFCPPSYPPETGGSGRLFQSLARHWVAAGGRATVWTMDDAGRGAPCEEEGVRVRRFRRRRWAERPPVARALGGLATVAPNRIAALIGFPHQASPALLRFLGSAEARREGPFDLVVGGVLPHTHLLAPALRFARRLQAPSLVVPLLHAGLLGTRPMRRVAGIGAAPALRATRCLVALTEAERGPLLRLGVPPDRIHCLGAAVEDRPPADPARFRNRHALRDPYIVQAGALSPDKGTLDLIAAHDIGLRAGSAVTLVLAGRPEPEVRARLRALAEAQRRRVLLHESPSDEDLASALAGACAVAHPTRADAYGLLVLEAWREGAPVIVAASGGPGQLVRHDQDGLIVPPGDLPALAAAWMRLVREPQHAARLVAAGRERWQSEGRWATIFPRWRLLFEGVMDGRP